MIIKVAASGKDAPGLSRYLFGSGKSNEHTNQHIVAGSQPLMSEWTGALTTVEATHVGRVVESAWRLLHAEQLVGVGGGTARGGGVPAADRGRDRYVGQDHVMHVTMALGPDETDLSDQQWQKIAQEYVERMGFTEGGDKNGCAWYAMRHGRSGKTPEQGQQETLGEDREPVAHGNDHIHLVVCTVRGDGGRASVHQSFKRSQEIRRELEQEFDFLAPLHDAGLEPPVIAAYTQGEERRATERAASKTGSLDPDRVHLQRVVRGAAQVASTEAEWIAAVLDADVDIEPRWAAGGRDNVLGYTVALDSTDAPGEVVRYGGSKLASDLTLAKLRTRWAGAETDESRSAAVAMWRGEGDLSARDKVPADEHLTAATDRLTAWNERLGSIDPADRVAWKREAAHAAGAISLVASRVDRVQGQQLGAVADRLVRSGQHEQSAPLAGLSDGELVARHLNLALRAGGLNSGRGWAAVMQQMARTTHAIQQAHQARGELAAAQRLLVSAPVLQSVSVAATAAVTKAEAERGDATTEAGRYAALHGRSASSPARARDEEQHNTHRSRSAAKERTQDRDRDQDYGR